VTFPDGKVWCLNRSNGKPVSTWGTNGYFKTVDGLDVTGSVSVSEEYIYFSDYNFNSSNSHLYRLDKRTGEQISRADVFPSSGTPAVGDGIVVTCGVDWWGASTNWTAAFAAKPGAGGSPDEIWEKKDVGGFNMSASIVDGKVLVGNFDANTWTNSGIYCLDADTGGEVWSSKEAGSVPVPTKYGV
ncbi:MAG: PQQ-binding-like beta-propeller repeat protein, partial [Actinobacteria bacterium]|nr:PQQ-binding-like beta-propeller repeat protein [Actinomycetota bacterium]